MKKYIYTIILSCVSVSAMAQDLESDRNVKTDLSNPDIISYPPMDPYSIFYEPPMPIGAENITTKEQCEESNGTWTIQNPDKYKTYGIIRGCIRDGKQVGRWLITSHNNPEMQADKKDIIGYIWFNDNSQREGWLVQGSSTPDDPHIVRKLSKFHNDLLDGPVFTWSRYGALSSVINYKDDILDGKYELYASCLPNVIGYYTKGLPTGTWEIYDQLTPGMLVTKRNYDKRLSKDRPSIGNPVPEIVWTEWYDEKGLKYAEGYSFSEKPSSDAVPYGNLQLFMSNGHPWITVHYSEDGKGIIEDDTIFSLCAPQGRKNAMPPASIDVDYDELIISCISGNGELYTKLHYYSSGEFWKKVPYRYGLANGTVHEYHPSGEKLAEYTIEDNVPQGHIVFKDKDQNAIFGESNIDHGTGTFQSFWYNGKIQTYGLYLNGNKYKEWTEWNENGLKKSSEFFDEHGNADGPSKEWYANGILANEIYYSHGVRQGTVLGNYTDGRIGFLYQYTNDSITGISYEYTHAGSIDFETDYRNRQTPQRTYYYTDGSKKSNGSILRGFGLKRDTWKYYTKSGTEWISINYKNGSISSYEADICVNQEGTYTLDDENRELGCQVCAVNRESPLNPIKLRQGKWTWWNDQGAIEKSGQISFGHLDGEWSYYYPNGKLMLKGKYEMDRRVGEWTGYYENGQKKFSGEYQNGVESGIWKTYHQLDGSVSSEGSFINGKREGEWIYRYSDGSVKDSGLFENNKETGIWTSFYPNGTKLSEGSFVEGKRQNEWIWYREDESEWKRATYKDGKEINVQKADSE